MVGHTILTQLSANFYELDNDLFAETSGKYEESDMKPRILVRLQQARKNNMRTEIRIEIDLSIDRVFDLTNNHLPREHSGGG